jgi:flagellar hook assembly protein FlgD
MLLALGSNRFDELSSPPLPVYYEVLQAGQVQIRVYNVADVLIRHLADASMSPGAYTIYWDGKDDTGAPAASGLYLVVLTEPGAMDIKKVLVLKQ